MDPLLLGALGLAVLLVLIFLRMPIGLAMGAVGFLGLVYLRGFDVAFNNLAITAFGNTTVYALTVLPLFLLMGQVTVVADMSKDIYSATYKWFGHLPGGLAIATTAACACFAAICGDAITGTATMATVALPEMRKYKYSIEHASGCIAAGGTLGILIPPSIILILYGVITEQSIGSLFIAGFLPGVLLALLYILVSIVICSVNPRHGPRGPKCSFVEKLAELKHVWTILALFALIIGGIYTGLFTPTEAGAIGAFGSFIILILKKRFTGNNIYRALLETMRLMGFIFLILIGAMIFSVFLSLSQMPFELTKFMLGLGLPPVGTLLIILLLFIIFGCIIDSLALVLLFTPIFFPVVTGLGFDPLWFGVVIVIVMQQGMMTPPIGMSCFIINAVAKDIPLNQVFRGVMPFWAVTIIIILILIAFPQVALFLPSIK
ncbi:MAG: TRAP transporter large permease [Deltaproteobacteria bacterium]|nr:TRAP transporter large permease [Deltaproteobacteria bacterium]